MSRIKTIFALIAVVLVAVFAVQNHAPVPINFLMYQVAVSHALVIVVSVAIGVIIGLIVGLNSSVKDSRVAKELNKKQTELQKSLSDAEAENQQLVGQIESLNTQINALNAQIEALQMQANVAGSTVQPADFNDSIDSMDI
ncbi:MAG: lipopolysaccharide assembly protein LapA domain-containing protein [Peptostreptococcaceae bacterium]|nr:lipopolysaccharide assembly protein LapA domain-containing protein [Peptostreptococcaceae bacterium]